MVYLCVSSEGPAANSLVAIKFSLAYSHEARHKRFLHEIAFLKKHAHPNILRVIDWGTWEENTTDGIIKYPFFVTEYLPKTLGDVIRERSANASEKAAYIMQVLSALAYLSEIPGEAIHRDVKPHNVFIAGKRCLLGDFGLMTLRDRAIKYDRGMMSESKNPQLPFYFRTPDLVRFERAGTALTSASDVYQLGLVAALLFTGKNPCVPSQDQLANVELEQLGFVPGVQGKGISMLIKRMLEFDPEKRPSARSLIDPWREVFWESAKLSIEVNGKAF